MELVIAKQSMMSVSECAQYPIPEGTWAKFVFEGCYPEGKGTISKGGVAKAQLSMNSTTVVIRESGVFDVCVLGRNTKSSIYVELIHQAEAGTVIVAPGDYITVDKSQSGNDTVYTVTGAEQGSHTVVRAGDNITVAESTEGKNKVYTVTGTEQGSHTVVKAGQNVTVTQGTEGNKTTYTINAQEQKVYKVTSTNANTLTVAENTSGNTTTFSLTATGGGGGGGDVELESTDPNLIITKE